MGKKIFVGNLSFDTTSKDLEALFSQDGTCESVAVITDRATGQSRGFGFVERRSASEAQKAIAEFNGKDLQARTLNVSEARERSSGGGGGGGDRGRGGFSRRRSYCPAPASAHDYQLHAAVHAEGGALPPGRGVLRVVARRARDLRVHDASALRAVADGGVRPAMIHVLARARPRSDHAGVPLVSSCRRLPGSRPTASHRFSKLNGQLRSRLAR